MTAIDETESAVAPLSVVPSRVIVSLPPFEPEVPQRSAAALMLVVADDVTLTLVRTAFVVALVEKITAPEPVCVIVSVVSVKVEPDAVALASAASPDIDW